MLVLCATLVTGPEVLFLDEPTERIGRPECKADTPNSEGSNRSGLTVFLTTHNSQKLME